MERGNQEVRIDPGAKGAIELRGNEDLNLVPISEAISGGFANSWERRRASVENWEAKAILPKRVSKRRWED